MKNTLVIILTFVLAFSSNKGMAQDYHFSQFDVLPVRLNPALTGMFKDYAYKSGAIYRNQWRALSVKPFSTFSLSYEMPLKNDRWGIGAYMTNYDGAKIYNEFNLVISGAYRITKPDQDIHILTSGLQAGFINKNINDKELTFNNQYDGGGFNTDLASMETFDRFSKFMPEINLGLYYEYGGVDDLRLFAGFSLYHITSPKNQFIESTVDPSRLPRRFVLHGGAVYKINPDYTVSLKTREMWQGKASEYYFGGEIEYLYERKTNTRVLGAVYYRVKDALVLGAGIEYKNLTFMMSYDITTSSLNNYNNGYGGLEFSIKFAPRLLSN